MDQDTAAIARAAAGRLQAEQQRDDLVPHLEALVQQSGDEPGTGRTRQFTLDPDVLAAAASLASAVAALATLAWTIYKDIRDKSGRPPARDPILRRLTHRASEELNIPEGIYRREKEIVVEETIEHGK